MNTQHLTLNLRELDKMITSLLSFSQAAAAWLGWVETENGTKHYIIDFTFEQSFKTKTFAPLFHD